MGSRARLAKALRPSPAAPFRIHLQATHAFRAQQLRCFSGRTKLTDAVSEEPLDQLHKKPRTEMDRNVVLGLLDVEEEFDEHEIEAIQKTNTKINLLKFDDPEVENDEYDSDIDGFLEHGEEKGELLGPEWVYDNKNHVYFNVDTKEVLVRKQESNKLWEKRRSKASLETLETNEQLAREDSAPALTVDANLLESTNLYPPRQMQQVRQKYQWMDFKELNQELAEADRRFFQKPDQVNLVPWTHNAPYPEQLVDNEEAYELEKAKFMAKVPYQYNVAGMFRSNMTSTGRTYRHGALMVGGNGRGWAGYGYGSGLTTEEAEARALEDIKKNLVDIPLLEGRTIYSTIYGKYGRTKVFLKRADRGVGIKAGKFMTVLCQCFGILDLTAKIIGPRNPLHVAYAAFEGLTRTMSTRQMALGRGMNYYKMFEASSEREVAPTKDELKKQQEVIMKYLDEAKSIYGQHRIDRAKLEKYGKHTLTSPRQKGMWNLPYYNNEDTTKKEHDELQRSKEETNRRARKRQQDRAAYFASQ